MTAPVTVTAGAPGAGDAVLECVDLVKHFPTGASGFLRRPRAMLKAVDGVSLRLAAGSTLGVVGESGCGKSTLGRMLTRLIEPTSGSVVLNGRDITALDGDDLRKVRREIQMIFQDPFSSLNPRHSVGQIIGTPIRLQHLIDGNDEVKARVQELMALVGLNPEHYNRYPHEFSGGQRQRIGIARALGLNPSVVVADEPVSALDVSIQAQILNLLEKLQSELGVSMVFIAHDLSVVRHIADQVAVMYLGKIVEIGPPSQVYTLRTHPYTRALLSAVPVPNPDRAARAQRIILTGDVPSPVDPPSGCRFRTRCPIAQPICAEEEPALVDRGQGHPVACHFAEPVPVTLASR